MTLLVYCTVRSVIILFSGRFLHNSRQAGSSALEELRKSEPIFQGPLPHTEQRPLSRSTAGSSGRRERGHPFPEEAPAKLFVRERDMDVSLARESPGEGPRATLCCTGRYKVEATADVLSQADMELGTESTSRRPCQTLSWELAELNPPGEKATGILVEHRHEAKECNGLNQSSSKNTERHPWAMRDGCFLVAPPSLEWAGKTVTFSRSAFLSE